MGDSALIMPVALPFAFDALRRRYDPAFSCFPAHVSLLFPFAGAPLRNALTPALNEVIGHMQRLTIYATGVESFKSSTQVTMYLKVGPEPQLVHIIEQLYWRFQNYPPYEGRHQELVPHITLARVAPSVADQALSQCRGLFRQLTPSLVFPVRFIEWLYVHPASPPIRQVVGRFWLSGGTPASGWSQGLALDSHKHIIKLATGLPNLRIT